MAASTSVTRVLHALRSVRSAVGTSTARSSRPSRGLSGWMAVTVLRPPEEVDVDDLPAPLAALRDRVEVSVRPASKDRGAELSARLLDATPGSRVSRLRGGDAEAGLRRALRESKQLLEVGEVLAVDPAPHGQRRRTPAGALLERWTTAAPQGGVR